MRPTICFVLLIIAAILLLCAAAGLTDWSLGSIRIQTGWAGLFFFVLTSLTGSTPPKIG